MMNFRTPLLALSVSVAALALLPGCAVQRDQT